MRRKRGSATNATNATNAADDDYEGGALSTEAVLNTYLPALMLALGTGIALPAVPTLARSFHVSFGVGSGVVTAFLVGNVIGALPAGWLIDRIGLRRTTMLGPLLTGLVALTVATAGNFPELLALRFVDGMAAQIWMMARLTAISVRAAPNQRGRQVGWMFGMDNSGNLLGPLIGGLLAASWGVRTPFVAYGIIAILAAIPAFVYAKDVPKDAPPAAGTPESVERPSLIGIVRSRWVYFALATAAGLTRGPISADLLHLYAAYAYHLGPREIGYLATGAALLTVPLIFIAAWMLDRFGRKRTMVPGFTGLAVAMCGLAASAFLHWPLWVYVTLFLAAAAAQGLTAGSIQTIGTDVAPPNARSRFLALWRFSGRGGVALSPVIFAFLATAVSYGASFVYIAGSSTAVAWLLRYVPETRRSAKTTDPQEQPAEQPSN